MRALALSTLVSLWACASPKPAQPAPITPATPAATPRARAERLVGLSNPTPSQWKRLGPGGVRALTQLASDPAETPERRARALRGMASLDDPSIASTLGGFATDANEPAPIRGAAALALAEHNGPAAVTLLTSLLADSSAPVRKDAAHALGLAGGDAAKSALQARLDVETDPGVRDELQKALTKTTN